MNESCLSKNTIRIAVSGQCLLLLLSFLPFAALKPPPTASENTADKVLEQAFSQEASLQIFEPTVRP